MTLADGGVLKKLENVASLSFGLVAEYPISARSTDRCERNLDTSIVGPDDAGPIKATLPRSASRCASFVAIATCSLLSPMSNPIFVCM